MEAEVIVEGRTTHRLPPTRDDRSEKQVERHGKGPADRAHRSVFHNPAMAGCRTRSVLLFDHILDTDWFKKSTVHTIDALCATGSRINRWLTELPPEKAERLLAVGVDLDGEALEFARQNCPGAEFIHKDARQVLLSSGWQWIDIDPFGSPLPFLDAAMQSSARKAVMEITATDTAALTGSTQSACMRRYGARIRCDEMAHDSALRLLMATIARAAARHDRAIEPLLSSWDSHHIRVSIRTKRSIESANIVEESLGYRIATPTVEEIEDSVNAGLHPNGTQEGQPFCLIPLSHPVNRDDPRVSGPLWTGPLFDEAALASMTVERAIELSGDGAEPAVRHWAAEAALADVPSLIITDMLPALCGVSGPPRLVNLVSTLQEAGHRAAIARWNAPAIRTDAPWAAVVAATKACQPPM
jgi:tRNA (guanine26-N2/guanine27-N2)-dimethyltransferase